MRPQPPAVRKISILKKELKELENDFFRFDEGDFAGEVHALKQRKEHLIRSIILELHLGIEDLLTTLIICRIILPPGVKKKFPRSRIKPELHDLMSGDRALGFAAKLLLARSLGVLSPKNFSKLKKLNSIRNRCSHNWRIDALVRRKIKRAKPKKPVLEYAGKSLLGIANFRQLISDYSMIYLRLYLRVIEFE